MLAKGYGNSTVPCAALASKPREQKALAAGANPALGMELKRRHEEFMARFQYRESEF